jgi:hypothetical protein
MANPPFVKTTSSVGELRHGILPKAVLYRLSVYIVEYRQWLAWGRCREFPPQGRGELKTQAASTVVS